MPDRSAIPDRNVRYLSAAVELQSSRMQGVEESMTAREFLTNITMILTVTVQ